MEPPAPLADAIAVSLDGQAWFHETCRNTPAHAIIAKIEALLANRMVRPGQSTKLLAEVVRYKEAVTKARCPLLCALFITVVKRLAFVDAPEDLYGQLLGTVVETWRTGLSADATNAQSYGKDYHPVFTIPKFLQGWIVDLKRVRKKALSAYGRFLRFHDVHRDETLFDHAVEAFVQRVRIAMTAADVTLAGKIALNFGQDILSPLLDDDRAMALKHTKAAAGLIDAAVSLDPVAALGNENMPSFMALRWLEDHIRQSRIPPLGTSRTSPELGSGLRDGAYAALNEMWRKVEPQYRSHMEQPYSSLLPILGGWNRREPRLAAPGGWWVWFPIDHAGKSWKVSGAVSDLCPSGRGFHVSLQGEVERCEDWKSGGGIDITFKGGETVPVSIVQVAFRFPDGSGLQCQARARRGWRYEVTKGVFKDFCGAVFEVDRPEDAADLRSRLGGLTAQVGMAAPPDRAPVPPVELMPAPTATGVSGQGGHEPPPQSDDARRGELKEAVAPQHAAEADWHDVQTRLLRLYESGEPFTSQRDLAVRLSCSAATINKAINDSPKLRGWMARQSKRSFKAQSLNEVVLDGNPSQRERDPSTAGIPQEDIDQIIAELAAKAPPAERARLSALTAQGRQELAELYLEQRAELHVEDDAPGGNRIIGRQP